MQKVLTHDEETANFHHNHFFDVFEKYLADWAELIHKMANEQVRNVHNFMKTHL